MERYLLIKDIYFFRHGETDSNLQHRRQGCEIDTKINANGRKQAAQVGDYLFDNRIVADLIISSNLSRATETAQIIASKINYQSPILIIDNLKERCSGKLAGLTNDEMKSNKEFDKYFELNNILKDEKDPIKQRKLFYATNITLNKLYGQELYNDFRHRLKKALKEIYNRNEKTIIIVSHGAAILQLLQIITNIDDNIQGEYKYGSNCHMSYIQLYEKKLNNKIKRKIKIIKLLTTAHLNPNL
jgi:broad specificity phosphatase PhoE